eukprot:7998344-Ditylum_brightwellii.AAC.1
MASHNEAASHDQDEAMAAADKEMEERANRAKELLSSRYRGLRDDQVSDSVRLVRISPLEETDHWCLYPQKSMRSLLRCPLQPAGA